MFDPRPWLDGVPEMVRIGWIIWLAWGLALFGWYRYARVSPTIEPRATPSPKPTPERPIETPELDYSERFGDDRRPDAAMVPTTDEAIPLQGQRPPIAAAPALYRFTTHRQDEADQPQA